MLNCWYITWPVGFKRSNCWCITWPAFFERLIKNNVTFQTSAIVYLSFWLSLDARRSSLVFGYPLKKPTWHNIPEEWTPQKLKWSLSFNGIQKHQISWKSIQLFASYFLRTFLKAKHLERIQTAWKVKKIGHQNQLLLKLKISLSHDKRMANNIHWTTHIPQSKSSFPSRNPHKQHL